MSERRGGRPLNENDLGHIKQVDQLPWFFDQHPDLAEEARIRNNGGPRGGHVQEAEDRVRQLNRNIAQLERIHRSVLPEARPQVDSALQRAYQYRQLLHVLLSTQ